VVNVTDLLFEETLLNEKEQKDDIIDGKKRLTEAQYENLMGYSTTIMR